MHSAHSPETEEEAPRRRGRIPQSAWPRILELQRSGLTLTAIAKEYECTPSAISYIIRKAEAIGLVLPPEPVEPPLLASGLVPPPAAPSQPASRDHHMDQDRHERPANSPVRQVAAAAQGHPEISTQGRLESPREDDTARLPAKPVAGSGEVHASGNPRISGQINLARVANGGHRSLSPTAQAVEAGTGRQIVEMRVQQVTDAVAGIPTTSNAPASAPAPQLVVAAVLPPSSGPAAGVGFQVPQQQQAGVVARTEPAPVDATEGRLRETARACLVAYRGWRQYPGEPSVQALSEAVHDLRKTLARIEIDISNSRREEQMAQPIPVPWHRASRRSSTPGGN